MGALNEVHLGPEELLQYFGKRLDDRRNMEIETHLGECAACAANASAIYLLEPVRRGLGRAVERRTSADASLISDFARSVAETYQEWWREALGRGLTKLLDELGEALRSAMRVELDAKGAFRQLQAGPASAVRVRGGVSRSATFVEASWEGEHNLRIRARIVEVSKERPRFAFMAPLQSGRGVTPARLQAVPGDEEMFEAIFEDLPDGEYLLVLELPTG